MLRFSLGASSTPRITSRGTLQSVEATPERPDWDGLDDMLRGVSVALAGGGWRGCNWQAGCLEEAQRGGLWS